jgi:uncharacterized protein (DUF1330 family)
MVQSSINNEEQAVALLTMKFGGKFSIRAGRLWSARANLMDDQWYEFPSMEVIHAFWNSPEFGLHLGIARVDG